jgi:hypothetical protein
MREISALPSAASVSRPQDWLARNLIPLFPAFGQDEANHGTIRYSIDSDGFVQVPPEAVGPLITTGGFVLPETTQGEISSGVLSLYHDDAAGCSYAGRQYRRDAKGNVVVPAEAASELLGHGFVPVFEDEAIAKSRGKSSSRNRVKKG